MKRVLSGIKPSGEITLGNYLGAIKGWAERQQADEERFYFVPNLHALTTLRDASKLKNNTLSSVAWLLAMGVDTAKSVIFVQSEIPAHSELCWILNNYVTMGELSRMTQYKDKSQKLGSEGQLVGLFDYPILMAADILLYDADEVPVGEDQVQHVELTRNVASRFNNLYGQIFKLPTAKLSSGGARIKNLQDPTRKMDKSDDDLTGVILPSDSDEEIRSKLKKAVTDSGNSIVASPDKPALSNLLSIYSLVTGQASQSIESQYAGKGYKEFKNDLAEALIDCLAPIRARHAELMSDHTHIYEILAAGNAIASAVANEKLQKVKEIIGLL